MVKVKDGVRRGMIAGVGGPLWVGRSSQLTKRIVGQAPTADQQLRRVKVPNLGRHKPESILSSRTTDDF
jgi:hypothetical protein